MIRTVPRTVAELAATSNDWVVQRGTEYGRWLTAERVVERDGRKWRLGLTPTSTTLVAFMLWLDDDELVAHARGTEAQMCALAHRQALGLSAPATRDAP
ncbi:hypothetical protein [Lentzea waywayandensis]|uniref:hypothetical protein n=1 Tax=Lentzea waywayandensis TaxID=84724 RepID=UPI001FE501E9|nr:hypothetical protein [Lentzea waywayandensis]